MPSLEQKLLMLNPDSFCRPTTWDNFELLSIDVFVGKDKSIIPLTKYVNHRMLTIYDQPIQRLGEYLRFKYSYPDHL